MPRHRKKIIDAWSAIVLFSLFILQVVIWKSIITGIGNQPPQISFLNVAQGESVLTIFSHNIKIMTDAGPDSGVLQEIQKIMPAGDNYIDLAIISYPQAANYGGYSYLLDHYTIGAFIYDGRDDNDESAAWQALVDKMVAKHIPLITLGAGDSIHYASNEVDILSPNKDFSQSAEPSDGAIVQRIITPEYRALLASDIGINEESFLLSQHHDLDANILKAPFPGSATTAGNAFLGAVSPNIIVVTPGVKNTASQPSKAALTSLASSTNASVLSPSASGTTEITSVHGTFLLYNK